MQVCGWMSLHLPNPEGFGELRKLKLFGGLQQCLVNRISDFAMVGDDGEEKLVETQQAGISGFQLLYRQLHLGFSQSIDSWAANQAVEAVREGGERKQDQQAVRITRLLANPGFLKDIPRSIPPLCLATRQ